MTPSVSKLLIVVTAGFLAVGCSLGDSEAPTVTGPTSQFGLSITMAASPEQLPRDGVSQSVVTVTVRDESGRPVPGQALVMTSNVGRILGTQVVTDSGGHASFTFVAPDASFGGNAAVIQAVPTGASGQSLIGPTLSITLTANPGVTNRTMPAPAFTPSPTAPTMGESVVFDATATTDEGTRCMEACTYAWDFGGEATATGRVVTYRFRAARTYAVRLTVTDAAGSVATLTQNVTVSQGTLPTAAFDFSPAAPGQFETVQFTAARSTAGPGRTIVSYDWNFGDGSTATGVATSHAFQNIGSGDSARSQTFTVTLTVTDSAGLQNSLSRPVNVISGVRAFFTFTDQPSRLEVIFNAEESRGSDNGFGGRNPIVKYIWHFGDSETLVEASGPITSHTYSFPSTTETPYRVTLTVQDSAGRRETFSLNVSVSAAN